MENYGHFFRNYFALVITQRKCSRRNNTPNATDSESLQQAIRKLYSGNPIVQKIQRQSEIITKSSPYLGYKVIPESMETRVQINLQWKQQLKHRTLNSSKPEAISKHTSRTIVQRKKRGKCKCNTTKQHIRNHRQYKQVTYHHMRESTMGKKTIKIKDGP